MKRIFGTDKVLSRLLQSTEISENKIEGKRFLSTRRRGYAAIHSRGLLDIEIGFAR